MQHDYMHVIYMHARPSLPATGTTNNSVVIIVLTGVQLISIYAITTVTTNGSAMIEVHI